MEAEFSEFTYGYAAIREAEAGLDSIYHLAKAPKLPSLLEEKNLGWDVRLAYVDYALFLQFKRSTRVSRRHPNSPTWPGPMAPHYRYSIDTDGHQHQALLQLEADLSASGGGNVFYAAPVFHRQRELDSVYASGAVLSSSSMVLPSAFGANDGRHHLVTTTPGLATIMSDPRDAATTSWRWLQEEARQNADRVVRRDPHPRMRVGDLEQALRASVGRLDRGIELDVSTSVFESLHRSAALLGCGLALVALDPTQV